MNRSSDDEPIRPGFGFLASALVVDDHAYDEQPEMDDVLEHVLDVDEAENLDDIEPSGGEPAQTDLLYPPPLESRIELVADGELKSRLLVDSFADQGIACALLAPRPAPADGEPPDVARVRKLASRADIVVLDWLIDGGSGSGRDSRELLRTILEADRARGGRLRLVCFYTGAPDRLPEIRSAVEAIAKEALSLSHDPKFDEAGVLEAEPLRVVIALKPSALDPEGKVFSVAEEDLPARLVAEFAKVARGMVRSVALSSLAAVRDGAHRLLARFSDELDPGLLSHRALVGHEETVDYALGLVGEELGAIVRSSWATEVLDGAMVMRELEKHVSPTAKDRWLALGPYGDRVVSLSALKANRLLQSGREAFVTEGTSLLASDLEDLASCTSLLCDGDKDAAPEWGLSRDLTLACLSSIAALPEHHPVDGPAPRLGLGVILGHGESKSKRKYYLCMQPACDSVRLDVNTAFPLIPLRKVKPDTARNFDIVIPDVVNPPLVCLSVGSMKLREMRLVAFAPDPKARAVRAVHDGVRWEFLSGEDRFEWLGTVRPLHASRFAATLGSGSSRIGLDEHEFQRLRATARRVAANRRDDEANAAPSGEALGPGA